MNTHAFSLVVHGLKSLRSRWSGVALAFFCVACVVFLFVAVLSMLAGFRGTLARTGHPDVAVVMRAGALSEVNSVLNVSDLPAMMAHPSVARDGNRSIGSGQFYLVVELSKRSGQAVNVPMRGIEPMETRLHPAMKLAKGHLLTPGTTEIVVGSGASRQFAGLDLGASVSIQGTDWTVVGIFEDDSSVYESEIWADLHTMQGVFQHQNTLQSLRVKLTSAAAFDAYRSTLESDPRFHLKVARETEYHASHGSGLISLVEATAYPMALLMMVGASFAALNAMYAAISARSVETATLRAIGFTDGAIAVSVLFEAVFIAVSAGVFGSLLTYVVVDGYLFSTMNGEAFSQVVFRFDVTPQAIIQGLVLSLIIGIASGLLPAWLAVRSPLHRALRVE